MHETHAQILQPVYSGLTALCRDYNDWQMRQFRTLARQGNHLLAIHGRHVDIHQTQVHPVGCQVHQPLLPIRRLVNFAEWQAGHVQ